MKSYIASIVTVIFLTLANSALAQSLAATLPTGGSTTSEVVDLSNSLLHVVNQGSNSLTTIDLPTRTVLHNTLVGSAPAVAAVTASGLVYVAANGSVTVVNPFNNYSTKSLSGVSNPSAMAYNPVNGKIYVVANQLYPNNQILIINPNNNNSETLVYESSPQGHSIVVDPNSGTVYVGSLPINGCYTCNDNLTVINPNTNNTTSVALGRENTGLAVAASGIVYAVNYEDNTLAVINPANNYSVTTIPVGNSPYAVALDSSGLVYVSNYGDNTVSVINPAQSFATKTVMVGKLPTGIAYDSNTNTIVVGCGTSASIISVGTLTVATVSGIQVTTAGDVVVTDSARGESYITGGGSSVSIIID